MTTIPELLNDLEAKAKQARITNPHLRQADYDRVDLEFRAACSPDRILQLVAHVRKLEEKARHGGNT